MCIIVCNQFRETDRVYSWLLLKIYKSQPLVQTPGPDLVYKLNNLFRALSSF